MGLLSRDHAVELTVHLYPEAELHVPGLTHRLGLGRTERQQTALASLGSSATSMGLGGAPVDTRPRIAVVGLAGERIPLHEATADLNPKRKPEAALVSAFNSGDLELLQRVPVAYPEVAAEAMTLIALRTIDIDVARAVDAIGWVLDNAGDPSRLPLFRRDLPPVRGAVQVLSGLDVDLPLGPTLLTLLAADAARDRGLADEALGYMHHAKGASAAAIHAELLNLSGRHDEVEKAVKRQADDGPLGGAIAVQVAAARRVRGDLDGALEALASHIGRGDPWPVERRALAERVHVHLDADRPDEAYQDLCTVLDETPNPPTDLLIARTMLADIASNELHGGHVPSRLDLALERARAQVRPRQPMEGQAGHFGGTHHTAYKAEISEQMQTRHFDLAERTLLTLLDVHEDEVKQQGTMVDHWYYETYADLARARGDAGLEIAVLERFSAATSFGSPSSPRDAERLAARRERRTAELESELAENSAAG